MYTLINISSNSRILLTRCRERAGKDRLQNVCKKKSLSRNICTCVLSMHTRARTYVCCHYVLYVREEYGLCRTMYTRTKRREGREREREKTHRARKRNEEREKDNTCTRACALSGILSSNADQCARVAWNERSIFLPSFSNILSLLLFLSYLLAPSVSRRVLRCTLHSRNFIALSYHRIYLHSFAIAPRSFHSVKPRTNIS